MPTETQPVIAEARTSCQRCHKRKKKCDRALPQCENCRAADVACSFLADDCQSGTYPIAFVRGLEARVQELEEKLALVSAATYDAEATHPQLSTEPQPLIDSVTPQHSVGSVHQAHQGGNAAGPLPESERPAPVITMAQELRILSLEAAAERHLGASSGLSFARLTQTILKRLTPDRTDFVFQSPRNDDTAAQIDWSSPLDLFDPSVMNLSGIIGFGSDFFGDMPLSNIIEPTGSLAGLALPQKSRADQLVSFYFAHSHTLYPILDRDEFFSLLDRIYDESLDPLTLDPVSSFRLWIVLAIGHSSRCSISMAEESEALLYYNKALEFFEAALEYGDMVALETITLQVSFSFFNQLGPNTWFLVGVAARMAIGLGLHTASAYKNIPFKTANMRKRVFFSIYMMDRVVSMALGRPFALQDDDIEVESFAEADDEHIDSLGARAQESLETPMMAIPCHILRLRRIASKISTQVYGNLKTIRENTPRRDEVIFSLHKELIEWRRSMPFPLPDMDHRVPHLSSNWYDFNYYTHLAMLYRPSPLFPTLNPANVKKLADAASMSIRQAHVMHRQKRFAYNWLNLLALFTSTLSLIYASTVQPEKLTIYLQRTQVIDDLELVLQLLEKLNTKFPGAKNIQLIIDRVLQRYRDLLGSEII